MIEIYKTKNGQLLFRKSFCAYLDILGFSQKIASNDLRFFSLYLNTLYKELDFIEKEHDLSGKKGHKLFELKIFTDNFVFGHPWYDQYGESELGNIFEVLSHIQFTFVKANIFIRGAISISNLYMDENIVLGPAIIESYKLESEKAINPRIVLSEDVVNAVKEHINYYSAHKSSPQFTEYLIDIDGFCFVNYLYSIFFHSKPPVKKMKTEIGAHQQVIIENLKEHANNFKLFNKYSWVANYHNYFCQTFLQDLYPRTSISSLMIDENLISKTISRIV